MIFPFFVKVHAASALFFVAFVFNSVYLFCLFVCTLSITFLTCDFLDLIISSGLLLRYSFAGVSWDVYIL